MYLAESPVPMLNPEHRSAASRALSDPCVEMKPMRITEQEIVELVAKEARVAPELLTSDANLAELDIQSLEIVEIIFALEERFGISIPFNANGVGDESAGVSLKTVRDIVEIVNKLAAEQLGVMAAD